MTSFPWQNIPLAYLLGESATADFFANYYEQQSLLSDHQQPQRFADLLSLARIDEIVSGHDLSPGALSMARKNPPIQRSFYTFKNGHIDRGAVLHHYQQGATIILPQLHLADARLASFCRALESVFSTRVQSNIYLTPPGNQGFSNHYDDHDVFVLQIAGEKHWRLYDKSLDKPFRGEKFKAAEHQPGALSREFTLKAGECVYVPRGMMHDAQTVGSEPSLHITVGLLGQTWADLMLEAMSEVALRNDDFRRCLPPGYSGQDFDSNAARQTFDTLLGKFAEQADFASVFELMRDKYLRSLRPDVSGGLLQVDAGHNADAVFKLRLNTQALLRHDESEAVLICAGGDIHFTAEHGAALQRILSGEPFTQGDLPEVGSEQIEKMLHKLLAFGLIVRQD